MDHVGLFQSRFGRFLDGLQLESRSLKEGGHAPSLSCPPNRLLSTSMHRRQGKSCWAIKETARPARRGPDGSGALTSAGKMADVR